jgi:hypothetical protein
VRTIDEFNLLKQSIEKIGYTTDEALLKEAVYRDALIVFKNKYGSRIDLFVNTICSQLVLSDAMIARSKEYKEYGKVKLMLISNEDMFLFKSLTDRLQDIDDCFVLINTGLDWQIILNECIKQHRRDVKWIFWVFEQLCRIEESKGITIPQKRNVLNICLKYWKNKPDGWMSEFKEKIIEKNIPRTYQKDVLSRIK